MSNWRGAAMGVSKDYDGLGKLKAVPGELDPWYTATRRPARMVRFPESFCWMIFSRKRRWKARWNTTLLWFISRATTCSSLGDDTKSYLLLGGKDTGGQGFHLTLAELRDEQKMDFKGIELLTLSGCQTAVGSNDSDGREIDGLGITAQRKGAKAVVATLWPVDDASVGLLMATFYKLWVTTPGMTKVEALQQAQMAVLHGTADLGKTSRVRQQRIHRRVLRSSALLRSTRIHSIGRHSSSLETGSEGSANAGFRSAERIKRG